MLSRLSRLFCLSEDVSFSLTPSDGYCETVVISVFVIDAEVGMRYKGRYELERFYNGILITSRYAD